MRTIKFRAWLKEEQEMIDVFHLIKMPDEEFSRVFTKEGALKGKNYTTNNTCNIMQFTGLVDKSGKEIYEGDILGRTSNKDFVFVVDFANGEFSGVTEPGRNHRLKLTKAMTLERSPYVEIIGNVHENPELLKEQS